MNNKVINLADFAARQAQRKHESRQAEHNRRELQRAIDEEHKRKARLAQLRQSYADRRTRQST